MGRVLGALAFAAVAWFVWLLAAVIVVLVCNWLFGLGISEHTMNVVGWTTATIGAVAAAVLWWRED